GGGGGQQPTRDTGVQDVPVQADQQAGDLAVDNQPDPGDGGVDTADATIECAPAPTGGPIPAGTAPMQAAGPVVASTPTRPELAQAVADGKYTIAKALAQGYILSQAGGIVASNDGGIFSSTDVTYSMNDNWDPSAKGIGDPATFSPMFTVAADGSGTHTTINAALMEAVFLATCSRVYIRVVPGTYREQVLLVSKASAPPITLYSTEADASKTTIVSGASAATVGNMSASATMTVKAVTGFQMKNITIANDYDEKSPGNDQSAVALLLQSDKSQFENVRFLGNIATLYVKSVDANIAARSYFRDCYVEGDQDIILGRGVAVFDHTEIKYLASRQPTGGIIANPSTLVYNRYGFLFDSCRFTAETGASGVFLAHQWMESAVAAAVGKMIVRNSTLGGHIAAVPWSTAAARMNTPKTPGGTTPILVYSSDDYFPPDIAPSPAEPFIGEYGNTGPGAHQP
ncbi:MAG: pectinesterase family protein, partial [Pseudomonadota bacterium]